jgi:radical SAM superfamily enzyme YgiQ (UPF0313 family)
MRILLVNPPVHRVVEPVYDRPSYPRTSLACLAGFLRARGLDVHVLDCKYDRLLFREAMDRVRRLAPDVVGFTGLTNEIKQAGRFAELVKAHDPSIVTVMGDVHMSALPERTLREFPAFDYGVIGEGEQTLYELCTELGGEPRANGVCFLRRDGSFVSNGARELIDVSELPMPAWDLFRPAEHYMPQTSRGCPFACHFCMNPAGRKVRARTPEQMLDELEILLSLGRVRSVYFGDEIFTVQRARILAFCDGMIERGYHRRLRWSCQTHVNTIDRELAERMRESGCESVGLGIETADENAMRALGKGIDRARVTKTAGMLREAGLPFNAFFILGQPNETIESAEETIRFAIEMNAHGTVFGIMVPYPGTRVGELAARGEGGYAQLSADWNDYNKQIGHAVEFVNVPRKTLERMQMLGYLKVYLYNRRVFELLRLVPKVATLAVHMMWKQLTPDRPRLAPPARMRLPVWRGD